MEILPVPGVPVTHVKRLILVVLAVIPSLLIADRTAGDEGFFYFDPDTKLHDFELLKVRFQEYLPESYTFQPFLRLDDFLDEVRMRHPRFMILTSTVTGELATGLTAVPLLVPETGGSTVYRKKLLMRGDGAPLRVVAATMVIEMPGQSDDWSWVIVSKDLDALLAVALGQVDAAIVDFGSIALLRSINPGALARLSVGDDTGLLLNAPLCYVRETASNSEIDTIRKHFLRMHEEPVGRELLLLLGYDRWREPDMAALIGGGGR